MDNWYIDQTIDLNDPHDPNKLYYGEVGDSLAHTWRVTILKNGKIPDLDGAGVAGNFLRKDGITVLVPGDLVGNVAIVKLVKDCYAVNGDLTGTLRLTKGPQSMTVATIVMPIKRSTSDHVVDPGKAIPNLDQLIRAAADANAATAAANSAATDARGMTDFVLIVLDFDALPVNTGFLGVNGNIASTTDINWRFSADFVPVTGGVSSVLYSLFGHSAVGSVCFYASDKTFIGGVFGLEQNVLQSGDVQAPPNAAFVRVTFSVQSGHTHSIVLKTNRVAAVESRATGADAKIAGIESGVDTLNETIAKNLEKYPAMDVDTNGDGIVDGWSLYADSDIAYQLGVAGGQALTIMESSRTSSGGVAIYKDINVTGAAVIHFEADYKHMGFSNEGLSSMFMAWQYDSAGARIKTDDMVTPNSPDWTRYIKDIVILSNTVKLRIYIMTRAAGTPFTETGTGTYKNVVISDGRNRLDYLESAVDGLGGPGGQKIGLIYPRSVYTVCDDVITGFNGRNRNLSAAIYLDHMLNGLAEELDIYFKSRRGDRLVFTAPMEVQDSNETTPAVLCNKGKKVNAVTMTDVVTGASIADTAIAIEHRSTLNSATKGVTPRVLCIGDSITYGELALVADDGYAQDWAYHLMCKELFEQDRIDNGGADYGVRFLGHFKRQRTMTYRGSAYSITTYHEGIRGISLTSYLTGGVDAFKSGTTGKFSLAAWLAKYRTMDDNGNRLTVGSGTGSLITAANINDIDVCAPTHVLLMLGTNGGGTLAQYQELIGIIKAEYPAMMIGLAIPDSAGTYFPSRHPNCGPETWFWNDMGSSQSGRHAQNYALQAMLQDGIGTAQNEANGVYLLPFFFTAPPAESYSMRSASLPDSDIALMAQDSRYGVGYGWCPGVHINGIGHINWAYQLYSWLKYTIAKSLG